MRIAIAYAWLIGAFIALLLDGSVVIVCSAVIISTIWLGVDDIIKAINPPSTP